MSGMKDLRASQFVEPIPMPGVTELLPVQLLLGPVWFLLNFRSHAENARASLGVGSSAGDDDEGDWTDGEADDDDDNDDEDVDGGEKKPRIRRRRLAATVDAEAVERNRLAAYSKTTAMPAGQNGDGSEASAAGSGDGGGRASRTGQPWTEEDLVLLQKAMVRYVGGHSGRWENIAEMVGRSVKEVTKKVKELQSDRRKNMVAKPTYSASASAGSSSSSAAAAAAAAARAGSAPRAKGTESSALEARTHPAAASTSSSGAVPTSAPTVAADEWSQAQQKQLEAALGRYPKSTEQRWQHIAMAVDGKDEAACMRRFKELALAVRKKRETAAVAAAGTAQR